MGLRLGSFSAGELRTLNLRLAEAWTNSGRAAEPARAYLVDLERVTWSDAQGGYHAQHWY